MDYLKAVFSGHSLQHGYHRIVKSPVATSATAVSLIGLLWAVRDYREWMAFGEPQQNLLSFRSLMIGISRNGRDTQQPLGIS